jgi:branched-subunit amino acid transport protein AzlD
MIAASIFSDFWNDQIVANEKQAMFLVLVGFILAFAFIRMSTRLMRSPKVPWWPGSVVSDGGVHLHHLVFGIVTMMISGALGIAALGDSPLTEICAFAFGVGAGLTIDEFALWVYLDDVYWAEEGRSSIDAMVIAAAGMMLVLLGFSPFSFDTSSVEQTVSSFVGAAIIFILVAICFAKQRVLHGTVGFFLFPVAIYGAWRLGKPGSAWARRRYGERNPEKQAAAEARFPPDRRTDRLKNAFRDLVGGKPSEGVAAAKDEAVAATREAAEELRHQAERVTHPGGGKRSG